MKAPPSSPASPASGLPEFENPPLEELLLELEDPLLEELLPEPDEPEEPEEPDELSAPGELSAPASVICATPLEEVEPQAVAAREAPINTHHSLRTLPAAGAMATLKLKVRDMRSKR